MSFFFLLAIFLSLYLLSDSLLSFWCDECRSPIMRSTSSGLGTSGGAGEICDVFSLFVSEVLRFLELNLDTAVVGGFRAFLVKDSTLSFSSLILSLYLNSLPSQSF